MPACGLASYSVAPDRILQLAQTTPPPCTGRDSRRPKSTSIKLDRRASVQNWIGRPKGQARRRLSDQLQRVDKVPTPKRSTDYVPHLVSLHMLRIACESPIRENQ